MGAGEGPPTARRWGAARPSSKRTPTRAARPRPVLRGAAGLAGPAMALAVGVALPLAAQYLSGAFTGWSRGALAVVAAGGFALLWWRRGKLTSVRFGLGLLAVAALAGGLWR